MTEAEWLVCDDPAIMLDFSREWASGRKLRLFACACCRRVWHLIPHKDSREAVEAGERAAESGETAANLSRAHVAAAQVFYELPEEDRVKRDAARAACSAAAETAWTAAKASSEWARDAGTPGDGRAYADLFRDVLGNPFRPPATDPAWLTADVVSLARAAFVERTLSSGELESGRLAVLSDALEEAGCDNADLLAHLRSPGPHVRGCWALDLILGKQ